MTAEQMIGAAHGQTVSGFSSASGGRSMASEQLSLIFREKGSPHPHPSTSAPGVCQPSGAEYSGYRSGAASCSGLTWDTVHLEILTIQLPP